MRWSALIWAFLAGVCVCVAVVFCFRAPSSVPSGNKRLYVARTTIMEKLGPPVKGQPEYYKMRLSSFGHLITSQMVMQNAYETLHELGLDYTPEQILAATTVVPVEDTSMIAIEVTLPDPTVAKVGADVVAAEAKRAYAEVYSKPGEPILLTVDPAIVRPYAGPSNARIVLASICGPLSGPIIGLLAGLALGILLTVLVRRRRSNNPNPQQGVPSLVE